MLVVSTPGAGDTNKLTGVLGRMRPKRNEEQNRRITREEGKEVECYIMNEFIKFKKHFT
jgi:hypothetical protein